MATGSNALPDGSLLYLWHRGHASLEDAYAELHKIVSEGRLKPGVPHLLDLSEVVSFDKDALEVMKINLDVAVMLDLLGGETLLVMYAPTITARRMAKMMYDFWHGSGVVVPRIADEEAAALAMVGRSETRFSELGFVPA
ncbi:MAG: hypothetical protein AAFQ54_00165 [Pseudomonadota bacterium]